MTLHLIYLAAGSARRFGSNKLLFPLAGKPLYRHGLDLLEAFAAQRAGCTVTVVSRYAPILEDAGARGMNAVDSPQSGQGVSFTIRAGLRSLTYGPEDYFLFLVADQPWLTLQTLQGLADAAEQGTLTACAAWDGRPGNPVLFSASLAGELLALTGDAGGRRVLRAHPERCRLVQTTGPQELLDLDTPPIS